MVVKHTGTCKPIKLKGLLTRSQSEFKVYTNELPKAQENAGNKDVIEFSF